MVQVTRNSVSDERTNPWGGISFGGAEKAEREQVQGAVVAQRAQRTGTEKEKHCIQQSLSNETPNATR
jgi:hypothetical protein